MPADGSSHYPHSLIRQCEIVEAAEALSAAGSSIEKLAQTRTSLDLWRLPFVVRAFAECLSAQADSCRNWSEAAAEEDVLLARELQRFAEHLTTLSGHAERVEQLAQDYAAAEAGLEDWLLRNDAARAEANHALDPEAQRAR